MDDIRLGAILLDGGIVDEAALERCLSIQALTGGTRPIGQILVQQGLLTQDALSQQIALQQARFEERAAPVNATEAKGTSLLEAARANQASELVVSEGRFVRIRVGTQWRKLLDDVVRGPEVWDFVREIMGNEVLEELADHHFVIRPIVIDGVVCGTATAFRQFDGVAVRVTLFDKRAMTPAEAGLPDQIVEAVRGCKGLVLVVGERGIGRADSVAPLVKAACADASQYVVVVSDEPVVLPTEGALVVRRRYGISTASRAETLRSVLREDPDVMVIGDVGCPETFEIALRAAEGGRLVIACLDAASATAALFRVLDFYAPYDLPRMRSSLAAVLRAVLVRHLVPDSNGVGAVAATELLLVDDMVSEVVRNGDLNDVGLLLRAEGRRCGYSLDHCLADLLVAGKVRLEDVFGRAEQKAWMLERTRNLQSSPR
ncbi:MAG TPA: ATPase, T2SS/T4P/T4SS family [Planctomycetota bacterium]